MPTPMDAHIEEIMQGHLLELGHQNWQRLVKETERSRVPEDAALIVANDPLAQARELFPELSEAEAQYALQVMLSIAAVKKYLRSYANNLKAREMIMTEWEEYESTHSMIEQQAARLNCETWEIPQMVALKDGWMSRGAKLVSQTYAYSHTLALAGVKLIEDLRRLEELKELAVSVVGGRVFIENQAEQPKVTSMATLRLRLRWHVQVAAGEILTPESLEKVRLMVERHFAMRSA